MCLIYMYSIYQTIYTCVYICVCVALHTFSTYHGTEDTGVMLFSVNDYNHGNEEPKQTVDDIGDIESQNYMGI